MINRPQMSEEPVPIIESAEELERFHAPEDNQPMQCSWAGWWTTTRCDELPALGPWRDYFAGGNNRPHWVAADGDRRTLVRGVPWLGRQLLRPRAGAPGDRKALRRGLRERLRRLLVGRRATGSGGALGRDGSPGEAPITDNMEQTQPVRSWKIGRAEY